jgi:hypothetical protein
MTNKYGFSFNFTAVCALLLCGFCNYGFSSIQDVPINANNFLSSFEEETSSELEMRISFGTMLNADLFNLSDINESTWQVIFNGAIIKSGKGLELFTFEFDKPGEYKIDFQEDRSVHHDHSGCNHYVLPETIKVFVSPVRIEFLCEQVTFSKPLNGGSVAENTIMSVPVNVYTYSGESEPVFVPSEITSYGIMTSLVARILEPIGTLTPGQHVFDFILSGSSTSNTYIGFDFIDNNGVVVPCGITTIVK